MAKIVDPVFGEMEEKHGWQKKEVVQFWNKSISFKIKAAKYENKNITDTQRKAYRYLLDNISDISEKCKIAIDSYKLKIGEESGKVIPKTMIFFDDGKYGILFDCEWDNEHGLAISIPDYTIGPQDMLL